LDLQISVAKDKQNISFFIRIASFSALQGHSVLLCSKQDGMSLFFFLDLQTSVAKNRKYFIFFMKISSFSALHGHSVLLYSKQDGMSLFFFGPSNFCCQR